MVETMEEAMVSIMEEPSGGTSVLSTFSCSSDVVGITIVVC